MESQNDLYKDILLKTLKIQENYPELLEYLDEMPDYTPSHSEKGINTDDLKDYLNSLDELLKTTEKRHKK